MAEVTLKQLLAAGAHFGHLTRRWDPRMKPYIFTEKNGIYIIDIKKTVGLLKKAQEYIASVAGAGEDVLFVGTKKQAKEIIKTEALRCNSYYVEERWLGGTLTNFTTIKKSIRHLIDLEKKSIDGTYEKITKKEILMIEREKDKMSKILSGIKEMKRVPGAVVIVDIKKEYIAVLEAAKLGIPVIALVDTNVNPEGIAFPIPANDDASHSIALIVKALADSVIEGGQRHKDKKDAEVEERRLKEAKDSKEKAEGEERRFEKAKDSKDKPGADEKRLKEVKESKEKLEADVVEKKATVSKEKTEADIVEKEVTDSKEKTEADVIEKEAVKSEEKAEADVEEKEAVESKEKADAEVEENEAADSKEKAESDAAEKGEK